MPLNELMSATLKELAEREDDLQAVLIVRKGDHVTWVEVDASGVELPRQEFIDRSLAPAVAKVQQILNRGQ